MKDVQEIGKLANEIARDQNRYKTAVQTTQRSFCSVQPERMFK